MIDRPDRARIWASQLYRGEFPPVCAMSGRPAETWRRFNFSTPPAWTYALLVLVCLGLLGLLVYGVIVSAVSLRARGHLPLTRSSRRAANLATWGPAGLILGSVAVMTAVIAAAAGNVDAGDPNAAGIGAILFLLSLFALLGGLIGRLVIGPLVVPRGKVEEVPGYAERIVELRNVHPAFAAAVKQAQIVSAQQHAGSVFPS